MYLVTVSHSHRISGHRSESKHFTRDSLKALADWCHLFIRSCDRVGWKRIRPMAHMDGQLSTGSALETELKGADLSPAIMLVNASKENVILIEIVKLATMTAPQAAEHYTGSKPVS